MKKLSFKERLTKFLLSAWEPALLALVSAVAITLLVHFVI